VKVAVDSAASIVFDADHWGGVPSTRGASTISIGPVNPLRSTAIRRSAADAESETASSDEKDERAHDDHPSGDLSGLSALHAVSA
jgi:hypothetical protein